MKPKKRRDAKVAASMTSKPQRRVLLIEDEMLLAMQMNDMLREMDFEVVSAGNLDLGVRLSAEGGYCCGVLDLNLSGREAYPIAEILRHHGIPFIYTTGYDRDVVRADFRDVPILFKPFEFDALKRALEQVLEIPLAGVARGEVIRSVR